MTPIKVDHSRTEGIHIWVRTPEDGEFVTYLSVLEAKLLIIHLETAIARTEREHVKDYERQLTEIREGKR